MAQTPRSSFRAQLRRVAAGITRAAPLPRGKRRVANMVGDWLGAPQQSEPRIVRMAAGFSLHVDLSSKNQRRMYFSGLYEPNVTRLFQTLLTTGDTVIDGGANIGYYSLLSSQCVGAGGAVHAFEPVPSTFGALEENIRLNACTNIAARQMAISDNSQGLTLELPTDERTGNFRDWAASSVILGQGPLVEVPSCSLDEYTADRQIEQIKLVKLDLEGAELSAIKGMQRLLGERRVSYLVCELNTSLLDASQGDRDAVRQALQEHGYRCYHISARGALQLSETPLVEVPEIVGDYLFTAPGAALPAL